MQFPAESPSNRYIGSLFKSDKEPQVRIMVGVPMTGLVRSEWVMARYGQVIPCNWSQVDCIQWLDQYSPLRFAVADARNIIASRAVEEDVEWLFFIDHDVILPPVTLLRLNEYMLKGDIPIVAGLYFTRSVPSEPLIYRGRGNSYFQDWKFGDKVWVDGHGMGCTLIHVSILKALYEESERYFCGPTAVRRIYESPAKQWFNPETMGWQSSTGTEDLFFLSRIMENKIFEKAGWPEYEGRDFPFLVDTTLYCRHIDFNGVQYPSRGEDHLFLTDEDKRKLGLEGLKFEPTSMP